MYYLCGIKIWEWHGIDYS